MKIIFVLPQIYPFYIGGAEIFHYHFLKALANNHQTSYIGYDNINIKKITFYKLIKIKPTKVFTPFQIITRLILMKSKYDLIHLNYCSPVWYHWFFYPILKRLYNIEYGITVHDGTFAPWKKQDIFKHVFKQAKFIVAVSERIKKEFEKRSRREVLFLPPVIPLLHHKVDKKNLLLKHGYASDDKILLFVGTLKNLKQPLLIVEALNKLDRIWLYMNKLKMIFVGSGNLDSKLKERINNYGLQDITTFLGQVPQEEINEYYKLSSFYIISSIHEGKNMSLIEAMFNKLPIIASNAPGINDLIVNESNGLLFDLDSISQLAEQIIKIVESPNLAERLANKAYCDYRNQFQFPDMLNQYVKLYKK